MSPAAVHDDVGVRLTAGTSPAAGRIARTPCSRKAIALAEAAPGRPTHTD